MRIHPAGTLEIIDTVLGALQHSHRHGNSTAFSDPDDAKLQGIMIGASPQIYERLVVEYRDLSHKLEADLNRSESAAMKPLFFRCALSGTSEDGPSAIK